MAERNSGHARDPLDWYVEDTACVHSLFNTIAIEGPIHDPCCGGGNIVKVARSRGFHATGADIVSRAPGFGVIDFFKDDYPHTNIITNPPFRQASRIVEHAKRIVRPGGVIAIIAQAKFPYSQGRIEMFEDAERLIHLSRRPSMPTGAALAQHGEAIRGGGSLDYCWCVWRAGTVGPTKCIAEWVVW